MAERDRNSQTGGRAPRVVTVPIMIMVALLVLSALQPAPPESRPEIDRYLDSFPDWAVPPGPYTAAELGTDPRVPAPAPPIPGTAGDPRCGGEPCRRTLGPLSLLGVNFLFWTDGQFLPGRIYTLVTSIFLHGSAGHLFFNAVALFILGLMASRHLTGRRYIAFFLATGAAGALTHQLIHWGEFTPLVGASGAAFGLFGGGAYFLVRHKRDESAHGRLWRVIHYAAVIMGLNLAFAWLMSAGGEGLRVSWEAHAGGFFAGLALWPLLVGREPAAWRAAGGEPLTPDEAARLNIQDMAGYVQRHFSDFEDALHTALAAQIGDEAEDRMAAMDVRRLGTELIVMLTALGAAELRRSHPLMTSHQLRQAVGRRIRADLPEGEELGARFDRLVEQLHAAQQDYAARRDAASGDGGRAAPPAESLWLGEVLAEILLWEIVQGRLDAAPARRPAADEMAQPPRAAIAELARGFAGATGWWQALTHHNEITGIEA